MTTTTTTTTPTETRKNAVTTTDVPADTRIMGVVHSALRRDLVRARLVLAEELPAARRKALAEHLVWMMDFLHHHHEGEDNGLYPLLLQRDPSAAAILEEMDGEHAAIHPAMDHLRAAAARLAEDAAAVPEVVAVLDELEAALLPHLKREEQELMPLVSASVTDAEWTKWDQDFNLAGKSPRTLAMEGHWLMDGTDAEDYKVVADLVPPIPRWVILNFMGGPYRRKAKALWSGTPAADVASQTIKTAAAPQRPVGRRMPRSGRVEVVVPATPEQVWAVLTDVTRVGEWSHESRRAQWTSSGPLGVGSTFVGSNKNGGLRWSRPCTIVEWEERRRLTWDTDGGRFFGDCSRWTFELTPEAGGTRIVQAYTVLQMPRWFEWLVVRVLPAHLDRSQALREDVVRLGEVASGEAASTTT